MTITLELPVELEDQLVAESHARGISVEEVVEDRLWRGRGEVDSRRVLTVEEVERGFDQAAALIPRGLPPLPDEAFSRESIYTREDEQL